MTKGKSTNGLMKHIRTNHNIDIKGSTHKRELLSMGYYHGYKRYRFIKNAANTQNFTNFSQIQAIHKFDTDIKALVYPLMIQVETNIKNRTIDCLVTDCDPDIESIYRKCLIGYRDYHPIADSKKFKQRLRERLDLRQNIDETIAFYYDKNDSLSHFIHNSKPVPLWAFFEAISFGQYGHFFSALKKSDRIKISKSLKLIHTGLNANGRLLEQFVFVLTDLRNATMHNGPVFDANFNRSGVPKNIKVFLTSEMNVQGLDFTTILDYIFLLLFLMKKLGYRKQVLKTYLTTLNSIKEDLYVEIPIKTYGQLLGMNTNSKIAEFLTYLNN